jgi:hypothetical protein
MPVFEVYRPFELARKFVFAGQFGRASGSLSPVQTVTASMHVPANRKGPMLGLALLPVAYWTLCASGRRLGDRGNVAARKGPVLARGYRRPIHAFNNICRCQGGQVWAPSFRAVSRVIIGCRMLFAAPSVRFNVRAILAARLFFLASAFNVRTGSDVYARRFDFLAM